MQDPINSSATPVGSQLLLGHHRGHMLSQERHHVTIDRFLELRLFSVKIQCLFILPLEGYTLIVATTCIAPNCYNQPYAAEGSENPLYTTFKTLEIAAQPW